MKKLTAGIFTVLMGLVSVNAADAAVASQGYVDFKVGENTAAISELSDTVQANKTAADAVAGRVTTAEGKITTAEGKITTLEGKVQSMEGGELAIGDGAVNTKQLADNSVTEAKLATDLATKINAAQTEAQVGTAIDAKITALDLANTYDAKGAATTAESNAKTYADGLNTAMGTRVGTAEGKITALESAGYQNADQVGTAIDGKISALKLGETYQTLGNLSTKIVEDAASAEKYTSETAVVDYVDDKFTELNGSNNALAGRLDTVESLAGVNADAIEAIQDETTGILATAMAEIDKKANSADVYTKTEADEAFLTSDEVEDKIEAAVAENGAVKTAVDTAVSTLENGAVKDNADAIEAINNETTGILAQAKTYAVGKANAALTASVKYTDDYITSLGLQQIASVPVECSDNANYCTLTANNSGFAWEVIARVEGETVEGRTAVTSKATAKPTAPSALTE